MSNYAHPETLVSTDWVAQHASDPNVRVVEVDVDTKAYDEGHVPAALGWAWNSQLCDTVRRDILPKIQFEELMASSGISNDTTVVIYGDNNNWFAAWALWQMKIYGHKDVRLMNGGRKKWLSEGRELSTDVPKVSRAQFGTGRRSQPAGVHGRDSGSSRASGDMPARRPYSGRPQYPLGQGVQR
jgi:thiosulfate/3-mercaptopyruvate sulfurtransferase